ncbi:MAG: hypothetical protein JKY52_05575 [Flavobacteriales bacterium]|nr:hypothetical protein [Flavobacteriales bacterium]
MFIFKQLFILLCFTNMICAQDPGHEAAKVSPLDVPVIRQPHPVTCVPASATAVMQYWGSTITYGEVSTKPFIGSGGVTYFEMQEWLSVFGFTSIVCSLQTKQIPILLEIGIPPVIALYSSVKHTVVCVAFNPGDSAFTIMDPLKGETIVSYAALLKEQSKSSYQAMLIFPDSINWQKTLILADFQVNEWLLQNSRYRSEALVIQGLSQKDSLLQLAYFARACTEDHRYLKACFHYSRLLALTGRKEEAWRELRKILLKNPSYAPALELKQKLEI